MSLRRSRIQVEVALRVPFPVSYKAVIRRAAQAAFEAVPVAVKRSYLRPTDTAVLSVAVVSPKQIQEMNLRFRKKNLPTDVLSFPPATGHEPGFLGDIALCWKVAQSQLHTFRTTPRQEVERLVVHGFLHLFGYDHETSKREAMRMFRLQENILNKLRPR